MPNDKSTFRNLELKIRVLEFPDYEAMATGISEVMETVRPQIEDGETNGSGITENGVKYSWGVEHV